MYYEINNCIYDFFYITVNMQVDKIHVKIFISAIIYRSRVSWGRWARLLQTTRILLHFIPREHRQILSTLNVAYREGNEANRHCHIDRMHLRVLFTELQNIHSGLKASAVVDPEVMRTFKIFRMSHFNLGRNTRSWHKLIPSRISMHYDYSSFACFPTLFPERLNYVTFMSE